jgi:hypothetical protein
LTQSWKPWNRPPRTTTSGGASMWIRPRPAVIHLGVAVGDQPAAAVGVLVPEDPVDHVGDGLEPAVGCQGCPWARPGRSRPHPPGPCARTGRGLPGRRRRRRGGRGSPRLPGPDGAVVTEATGRSAAVGSAVGMRGRATVSALMAGMSAPPGVGPRHMVWHEVQGHLRVQHCAGRRSRAWSPSLAALVGVSGRRPLRRSSQVGAYRVSCGPARSCGLRMGNGDPSGGPGDDARG